ncbi:MAG: type II toxin-antitoxin system RatA family toxin [Alphaproteobacteria bacterium]|nr:type II toxin-antitoxin system RatA family toxin [Alphaproteobacteria bacterium]
MPQHFEHRILPYPADEFYHIVTQVEQYPHFVPWLSDAQIIEYTDRGFIADLTIGYLFYKDTFRSEVLLTPQERIDIHYISGPFKHLHNCWTFKPTPSNGVEVTFSIDFEFKSTHFQRLMNDIFRYAVGKTVTAFEHRAHSLRFRKRY